MKNKYKIFLLLIFFIGLILRLYGLDWDQGQHLHPDERFLTMYAVDTTLPSSLAEYLSVSSPFNPYNYPSYKFFVYGTFPVLLTKLIATPLHLDTYQYVHLVGRFLSALFDSLVIFVLFYFFKLILNNPKKALIAPLIYATTVLPIQLSHFFAVDTFLNFFIFASFTSLLYWLYRHKLSYLSISAICFSLALSSKITAIIFAPIIFLIFLFSIKKSNSLKKIFFPSLLFSLLVSILIRFFSPHYFIGLLPNPDFISSLSTLKNLNSPFFPPAVQWFSKTKFIFPLGNLIFWGLGLPFSLAFVMALFQKLKKLNFPIFISFVWIFLLFIFQSAQFSYALRYYLFIFPSLIVVFSYFFQKFKYKSVFFFFHFLFLIAFLNIYRLPHSRLQASSWIYQNVPPGSSISCDHWDDCLPLSLLSQSSNQYNIVTLHLFDSDSVDKWITLPDQLHSLDYIIMSSNRLWASIPKLPDVYPQTTSFYQHLFSGQNILNSNISFSKIAQFNNYPGYYLPFIKACIYLGPSDYPGIKNKWVEIDHNCFYPGIYFRDDTADESFTVYDHPQVLIFKKK